MIAVAASVPAIETWGVVYGYAWLSEPTGVALCVSAIWLAFTDSDVVRIDVPAYV